MELVGAVSRLGRTRHHGRAGPCERAGWVLLPHRDSGGAPACQALNGGLLVLDILHFLAAAIGLIIIFAGFVLIILAENAPERLIDLLETLLLVMVGRRPRRRQRTYAPRPQVEETVERLEHEHHELVAPRPASRRRKRRIPWRLLGGVAASVLALLMGYPFVHEPARIAAKDPCPPTAINQVVLRKPRVNDDALLKVQQERPCLMGAGEGLCGLVERHAPFLESILMALHMCPGRTDAVLTTVHAVTGGRKNVPVRNEGAAQLNST